MQCLKRLDRRATYKSGTVCTFSFLLASFFASGVAFAQIAAQTASSKPSSLPKLPNLPGASLLTKKLVWAHSMECFPLELREIVPYHPDTGYETYGANYPLEQEIGLESRTGKNWKETDIRDAKGAGIDAFHVDIFTSDCEDYFAAADKVGGFLIAPCLDMSLVPPATFEDVAVETLIRNCRIAQKYHSPARVGESLVFFNYGTEQASPETWNRIQRRVAEAGFKLYFVGATSSKDKYIPCFDAGYSFGSMGKSRDEIIAAYKAAGKPFMGGMMPGYYRRGAGYLDADGTATYRSEWHRHLEAKLPWIAVATWNDLDENTQILPSADFNETRSDITRWFSAKFKESTLPWNEPRLYITTPKTLYPGQKYHAEALVLNGGRQLARVKIEIVDGNGMQVAGTQSAAVIPTGVDGAAVASITLPTRPARGFVRALASVSVGGRTISSVIGAPCLWLDATIQPGFATTYYSIPARNALRGTVQLRLTKGAGSQTVAMVLPPVSSHMSKTSHTPLTEDSLKQSSLKFVDLMHNTDLVRNFFTSRPFVQAIPRLSHSGAVLGQTEWGYYVARVTDESHRVAYSDPVYVAPAGDLRVTEEYLCAEGTGTSLHDASAYKRIGELKDVLWNRSREKEVETFLTFNGVSSRIDLPLGQGPSGPMTFTLQARPHRLGGTIYCDSGGMWLEIAPDGTARLVRLSPNGWTTVSSKAKIPLDQWTRFRCVWDGKRLQLYLNGKLDAEAPCLPAFSSNRRSLGCNPYDSSNFWNGDINYLKIERL